jgi:hypothetical protein
VILDSTNTTNPVTIDEARSAGVRPMLSDCIQRTKPSTPPERWVRVMSEPTSALNRIV